LTCPQVRVSQSKSSRKRQIIHRVGTCLHATISNNYLVLVLAYKSITNALKSDTIHSHRGKVVVLLKLHCLLVKDDQSKDETCTIIWPSRELRVSHLAQDQKGFGKPNESLSVMIYGS
jgi:hypothetical protein